MIKFFYIIIALPFLCWANPKHLNDMHISCQEMEQSPKEVFSYVDLGTGYGSPVTVAYNCPKGLTSLDILQPLLKQVTSIRSQGYSRCEGSIVHAQRRYYAFDLLKLGYYPQGFVVSDYINQNRYEYLKEWGYTSIYNYQLSQKHLNTFKRLEAPLTNWYKNAHNIDLGLAKRYSQTALTYISDFSFGRFSSSWQPEIIVEHTDEAIRGIFENFTNAFKAAPKEAQNNSLRRLLLNNISSIKLAILLPHVKDMKHTEIREPMLSFAFGSIENLMVMLESGFSIDEANAFGKTALFYAIQYNLYDVAKLLIEYGADVNKTYKPHTSLDIGCSGIRQWQRTPLMHAAQHADEKMLELLLSNGANIHSKDSIGDTALDYAEKLGNMLKIKKILSKELGNEGN